MSDSEEELFESDEEGQDFSDSGEDWVPEKGRGSSESEIDDDVLDEDDSESHTSPEQVQKKRNSGKTRSTTRNSRSNTKKTKKVTFATSHKRLYQKYKSPERSSTEDAGIPTSLNDILQKAQYKTKKMVSSQATSSTKKQDDSDSDSSGDEYLVDPNELDFNSDFFKVTTDQPTKKPESPKENDTSDEEMPQEENDKAKMDKKSIMTKINQESSKVFDFNEIQKKNEEFENAKQQLTRIGQKNRVSSKDVSISQILKMGETEMPEKESTKKKRKAVESDNSDWDSVNEDQDLIPPPSAERKDVQITIEIPNGETRRKKDKKDIDLEAQIKRKLNRIKKENQVYIHKVHVLCWIAYGNRVSQVLNNTNLYKACLKTLPGDKKQCYPKDKTDLKYYEHISAWFKSTFKLKEATMFSSLKQLPALSVSLALQIQEKQILCKRDFVFIFCILLRAMGFQCRLVLNFNVISQRPPQNELCKVSAKSKLFDKYKSPEKQEGGEKTSLDEIKKNKKGPVIQEDPKPKVQRKKKSSAKPKIDQTDGASDKLFNKQETNSPTVKKKSNKNEVALMNDVQPSPRKTRNQRKVAAESNLVQFSQPEKKKIAASKETNGVSSNSKRKAVSDPTKEPPKKAKIEPKPSTSKTSPAVVSRKRKIVTFSDNADSDDDFRPTIPAKMAKKTNPVISKKIDRRVLSTDDETKEPGKKKKHSMDFWVEVYAEKEKRWVTIDLFKPAVDCVEQLCRGASSPMTYILAWNNDNSIKDVSPRYCEHWNTVTRKLRAEKEWFDEAIGPYHGKTNARDKMEDKYFDKIHSSKPLPTVISDFKNHPLYALERHLLKFEAMYPPDVQPIGWIRKEPVYPRDCVYVLHTREKWVKDARVVKLNEKPYKVVTTLKWDRVNQKILRDVPCEIYGIWQTEPYKPPTAKDGIVPRNEYGNVELFKECMLPINTVHIKLPGLNKVCKKLGVDCASAIVGFDYHQGWSHPVYDGFVVCKEFEEVVTEAWFQDQQEEEKKERDKIEKRVYDNWKKLIKGLLIRERLQKRYKFKLDDEEPSTSKKKQK